VGGQVVLEDTRVAEVGVAGADEQGHARVVEGDRAELGESGVAVQLVLVAGAELGEDLASSEGS
jgi:hypothetical protein